jgi:HTH-type transcriptional regulator, glycine betaine synthesis regulator
VTPSSSVRVYTDPKRAPAGGLEALENEVIELFVELAGMLGLPRSYGEIYGLLYTSARPLSFTEVQERLGISKGSVSQGLRALRAVGALKVVPVEEVIRQALGPSAKNLSELSVAFARGGVRRSEYYVPETELRTLMAGYLRESIEPQLKAGVARVGEMRKRHAALLAGNNGDDAVLQERLQKLQTWHRKGSTLLPIIAKVLG